MIIKKLYKAWFYFRRGHSTYLAFWMNFLNFLVIQYQLLIKNLGWFESFKWFIIFFVPLYFLIAFTIGFFERKKKILETEVEIIASENPVLREIIERLDRIEKSLKKGDRL